VFKDSVTRLGAALLGIVPVSGQWPPLRHFAQKGELKESAAQGGGFLLRH